MLPIHRFSLYTNEYLLKGGVTHRYNFHFLFFYIHLLYLRRSRIDDRSFVSFFLGSNTIVIPLLFIFHDCTPHFQHFETLDEKLHAIDKIYDNTFNTRASPLRIPDKRIKRNDHCQRQTKRGPNIDGITHSRTHVDRVVLSISTLSHIYSPKFQPSRFNIT